MTANDRARIFDRYLKTARPAPPAPSAHAPYPRNATAEGIERHHAAMLFDDLFARSTLCPLDVATIIATLDRVRAEILNIPTFTVSPD